MVADKLPKDVVMSSIWLKNYLKSFGKDTKRYKEDIIIIELLHKTLQVPLSECSILNIHKYINCIKISNKVLGTCGYTK